MPDVCTRDTLHIGWHTACVDTVTCKHTHTNRNTACSPATAQVHNRGITITSPPAYHTRCHANINTNAKNRKTTPDESRLRRHAPEALRATAATRAPTLHTQPHRH